MRKHMVAMFFVLLCAGGIVQLPQAAYAALGVDFSQTVPYENGSVLGTPSEPYPVVGWSFKPTKDLYLTALGLWDQDVERRHSETHLVGIWNENQDLLGSVSIAEPVGSSPAMVTGSYGAQYHFANLISPLLLKKDEVYYVAATLFAGTPNQGSDFDAFASFNSGYSFTVNGDITFMSNAYGTSSVNQLVFPGQVDQVSTYLFGANIDVTPVPIPAAVWLLGSGFLGLVGLKSRSKE